MVQVAPVSVTPLPSGAVLTWTDSESGKVYSVTIGISAQGIVVATPPLPPAPPPSGPNLVTPGALSLTSTFESLSVRAKFSGDANASASAIIRYRTMGGTWKQAYLPIVDRRASINGVDNTAYVNEARGSVVGLTPNTPYEIELTWMDVDGINGAAAVTGSVSTLSLTPPASGIVRWVNGSASVEGNGSSVSPFKTITNAIAQSNPGDTITVKAGTYPAFTISKSGTASDYFILKANPGETATISFSNTDNLVINANYWKISGFSFASSRQSAVRIPADRHHIYIEGNTVPNVGTSNVYGSGAVDLGGNVHNVYVLNNNFTRTSTGTGVEVDGVWIDGTGLHTLVVAGNTISGNFWDGIGNSANSFGGNMDNSDFARNTFSNWQDDAIETDGGSVNVRVWGNRGSSTKANSAMSESTIQGPSYIFRNVFVSGFGGGVGLKQGHNGVGWSFIFHNVIETTGGGGNEVLSQAGGAPLSENHVYRNNIFKASGNIMYREGRTTQGNSYNYNLAWQTNGAYFADLWNLSTIYENIAAFRTGTGQELQGKWGDPLFVDSNKTISATSPAKDAGVSLPNFNDAGSAWPSIGAPDMGAVEVP